LGGHQAGKWHASIPRRKKGEAMIILGIVLLLLGVLLNIPVLTTIGIIVAVIGAAFYLVGSFGRPIAGRRHYW